MAALNETVARRGTQVRCPECARFKVPSGVCPFCGCGEIPPERYGAARMLIRAGVDRFALAQRVAALEPRQAELLEHQYAEQWARVQVLLEDVRRCEAALLQRGFVEEAEEALVSQLPMHPEQLAEELGTAQRRETLEEVFSKSPSWFAQRMAAIALLHRGNTSPSVLQSVHLSVFENGRLGVEAMFALTRWKVWRWARLRQREWSRVRELAREALALPELAPRAAVAWVRASPGKEPEVDVLFALRQGLAHADPDVRFECALCLKDEAGLTAALDAPDAEQVSEARRTLASLGSSALFQRLAGEGGAAFARDVVATLHPPLAFEAVDALLFASERGPDRLTESLRNLIEIQSFAESSEVVRERWRSWARSTLHELPGDAALRILWWAARSPVVRESMRPFVDGTARALAWEEGADRAKCINDVYFSRFLALAGPDEERLLHRWAREPECAPPLMQALMTLTSRIQDWDEPAGQAARLWVAVWEGVDRPLIVDPLRQAVREWSGISGRDELIDAVWRRFQQHPDERADLLSVFEPWRQDLWERQLASPEDAVARFEAWWRVDPQGFARQADLLVRDAPVKELPRRVRAVLTAAEEVVTRQPWIASLGVFYAAAPLAGAFRAGEDQLASEAEAFLKWFPAFEQRVLTTPAEKDDRAPRQPFLDELHTEVRLMRERLDVVRDEEDRKWHEEMQRRVNESRRKDQERQAREAERQAEDTRRAMEEAVRASEESRRAEEARRAAEEAAREARVSSRAGDPAPLPGTLRPRIPPKPIDHEIIFPGKVLATLMDYARLLKAMSQGGDALKAIADAGLSLTSWPEEATAWGKAMMGRLELAMRFGELFNAPWE
ncbi:hypothetical protein [Hyalangium versicolor]|uniref:hypothetical protein n=1 Tax=Hyalangium versicolor TaxID=2861190 RepID=UPI001CC9A635|nr:hypothetical protein [Hyalangium versicolor]